MAGNADLQTETRFSFDLPRAGKPFLDLQTRFADGDVTAVPRYLPAHIMPPGVVTWLDRAFLGGRVRGGVALFHGRPADFPFDEHNGVFLVSADVENAGLDYGAGWPRIDEIAAQVNFSGRSMSIDAASGGIFAAQLGPTKVSIEDLRHGVLQIDGSAQSSNADLLRFLRESPLSVHYRDTLAGLTARGDSRLTLSLNLPLTPHDSVPLLLGRVDFNAGALALPGLDLTLDDINGPMDFTATGLFSSGLRANLSGNAVTITAQAQDSGPNAGTRARSARPHGDQDAGSSVNRARSGDWWKAAAIIKPACCSRRVAWRPPACISNRRCAVSRCACPRHLPRPPRKRARSASICQ